MSAVLKPVPESNGERPGIFKRWRPRKWHVVYDQIVALDTLGKPQKEIAELFNYTVQHVSNICQCPEAAITRGRLMEQLQQGAVAKLGTDLEVLAVQAKKRLAQMLYDDDLYQRSPFQVVDRGITVLSGVGRLKSRTDAANKVNVERAIILTADDGKAIRESLQKADAAKRLHAAIEVEVEEKVG